MGVDDGQVTWHIVNVAIFYVQQDTIGMGVLKHSLIFPNRYYPSDRNSMAEWLGQN